MAFVAGVNVYDELPGEAQLSGAVSDAELMARTLKSLDPPFEVTLLKDVDWKDAQDGFDSFLDKAKGAECALVYFAGHGVEYYGENFLLVRSTSVPGISPDVERMKRLLGAAAVSLQTWVDRLDATRAKVKVVILDCCRNNPLKAESRGGTRSVVGARRGLAQVAPPSGTLISYSADAGQEANDGLFTEVLTNNLKSPGLNIVGVFAKTREEVRETSTTWAEEDAAKGVEPRFRRSRHEPAEYSKLDLSGTTFSFTRGAPANVNVELKEALGEVKPVPVTLTLDKSLYLASEIPVIRVKAERDCHVGLFYEDAVGEIIQLFPSGDKTDTRIPGGEEITLMPRTDPADPNQRIVVEIYGPPFGKEHFIVVATEESSGITVPAKDAANPFPSATPRAARVVRETAPKTAGAAAGEVPASATATGVGTARVTVTTRPREAP